MQKLILGLIAAVSLTSSIASAGTLTAVVDSHVGPWLSTTNPALSYGVGDNNGPVTIGGFAIGETVTISATGLTSEFFQVDPDTDANGWPGYNNEFTSDHLGSTGTRFPGYYTFDPANAYLGALIGAFADSSGVVQGGPFVIGVGPMNVTATGAYLLLGINDDFFGDNSGQLNVAIAANSIAAVPEPTTWTMMFLGFAGVGVMAYRRRKSEMAFRLS